MIANHPQFARSFVSSWGSLKRLLGIIFLYQLFSRLLNHCALHWAMDVHHLKKICTNALDVNSQISNGKGGYLYGIRHHTSALDVLRSPWHVNAVLLDIQGARVYARFACKERRDVVMLACSWQMVGIQGVLRLLQRSPTEVPEDVLDCNLCIHTITYDES